MYEDKMIEVLAQVEEERILFQQRKPSAVGFDMTSWHHIEEETIARLDGTTMNVCRTTACLAGHAAIMEGYEPVPKTDLFKHPVSSDTLDAENLGGRILGLTNEETNVLFYLNDLDDVYEWVAEKMGVEERVLRDKVTAARTVSPNSLGVL